MTYDPFTTRLFIRSEFQRLPFSSQTCILETLLVGFRAEELGSTMLCQLSYTFPLRISFNRIGKSKLCQAILILVHGIERGFSSSNHAIILQPILKRRVHNYVGWTISNVLVGQITLVGIEPTLWLHNIARSTKITYRVTRFNIALKRKEVTNMKEIFNLLYISLTFYIYYRINLNKNQNLIAAPMLFN